MNTPRQPTTSRTDASITTAELAIRTAGGDDYIRTKDNQVKGLALSKKLNTEAPEYVVVGKGQNIQARAKRFLDSGVAVPTYLKIDTNAWELAGTYRAVEYLTDHASIQKHCHPRSADDVAGILRLECTDEVEIEVRGGGFANPETRRAVELAAVRFVQTFFEAQGYTISDYQSSNLGYDLLAVKSGSSLKLEVKGTDGSTPRFFLTRNEHRCATRDKEWRLVIVTSARVRPQLRTLTFQEVKTTFDLDPLVFECSPKVYPSVW